MSRIKWTGDRQVQQRMRDYGDQVKRAKIAVANYWAPVIETYAKTHRPWMDRTGNARAALHAFVQELSNDTVALYLSHGVDYGLWLEIKYAGRYAIIMPTLQAHYDEVGKMLRGIFGR
jgi:hypothetical protein